MRANAFHRWLLQTDELTPSQRQQALEWFNQEHRPEDVIRSIVDAETNCPYCHHTPCGHWGNAHGLPRYRCNVCHRTFNALTGTPLAHLRHRECWPMYAQAWSKWGQTTVL